MFSNWIIKENKNREEAKRLIPNTKVVDRDGLPKMLYHGTASDFKKFSLEALGKNTDALTSHLGFFFTNNSRSVASTEIVLSPYS